MFVAGYHFLQEVKSLWVQEAGSSLTALLYSTSHAHNCFAGFSSLFLLLLHKLNLVQEIQVLALAVVLMVLVPSSWCRKHRRLLTCASRQLSRLVSASSAFPHKSSVFLLELLLASTVSYLFIADARSSLRSMVPKISLHQYCHR